MSFFFFLNQVTKPPSVHCSDDVGQLICCLLSRLKPHCCRGEEQAETTHPLRLACSDVYQRINLLPLAVRKSAVLHLSPLHPPLRAHFLHHHLSRSVLHRVLTVICAVVHVDLHLTTNR